MGSCGADNNDAEECWICLGGPGGNGPTLSSFCACKMRVAHGSCHIRWQLAQLERGANTACRFCGRGPFEAMIAGLPRAQPTMKVEFGDRRTAYLSVSPGPRGRREFQDAVRRLYDVHPEEELLVSFQSYVPVLPDSASPTPTAGRGHEVALDGWHSYDTVVLLAQVQAAARGMAAGLPPMPPILLPPAGGSAADATPAPLATRVATAAASSQPALAAAVANLGLTLPGGASDFGSQFPETDVQVNTEAGMMAGEWQPHTSGSAMEVESLLGWQTAAARRTASARTAAELAASNGAAYSNTGRPRSAAT